jgi:hypothetical protein
MISNNNFSIKYYDEIIKLAKSKGYKFVTLNEFINLNCPKFNHFILRHDLDKQPLTLKAQLEVEIQNKVRSTTFARVTANEYNFSSYPVIALLKFAEKRGFEIGLHSNFLEYSKINKLNPIETLQFEFESLKHFFDIRGLATHRDLNYAYNSLPYVENNWGTIKDLGIAYHAYEEKILSSCIYVNEGFNPHLCWRDKTPEQAIGTEKSICLLTHNHWWYTEHPFEHF